MLTENRRGLVVAIAVDVATGKAERDRALEMVMRLGWLAGRRTLGADKGYDTRDFVAECRARNVTPHVAQNVSKHRRSAIDARTTSQPGYAISQRVRKRVEEVFGWMKTVGNFRKTRFMGLGANQIAAYMVASAYNILRVARLIESTA